LLRDGGNGSSGDDRLGCCDTFGDELGEMVLNVAPNGSVEFDVICFLAINTALFDDPYLRKKKQSSRRAATQ
jgi:hypothetical protein